MITIENLSLRRGTKLLLNEVSLQLNKGKRYGLVGANGAGKSSLINALAGDIELEKGSLSTPSDATMGFLNQDHYQWEKKPIIETVICGNPSLWHALEEKEKLFNSPSFGEEECRRLEVLEEEIAKQDGYAAEAKASTLLEGLGIEQKFHQNEMSSLSGGYKLRVLLAQLLFREPEILVLDEPTNHLDIYAIRWLEGYLRNFQGLLLVSSHDRHFLDNICDEIIDLDYKTLTLFKGNYTEFTQQKELREELRNKQIEKGEKRKDELLSFVNRFRSKASKARQAQSKLHLVEKLEKQMDSLDLSASSRLHPRFHFAQKRSSGAISLTVKEVNKSFGSKQVLHDISFEVEKGERIALIGPNGIGKSTLLEILTDRAPACSGVFNWGFGITLGYFPQNHSGELQEESTLLDWLQQCQPSASEQKVRSILGKMLFSGDDVKKSIKVLSGGEKARLLCAKWMLLEPNILLFDEPTNHLDMEAIDALMEALKLYPGTLLFVSHNRYFVSALSTRIIELSKEGAQEYRLSFDEYLALKGTSDPFAVEKAPPKKATNEATRKKKEKQKRHVAQLEQRVEKLEEEKQSIEHTLGLEGFYQNTPQQEIDKLLHQKSQIEANLKRKTEDWEAALINLEK